MSKTKPAPILVGEQRESKTGHKVLTAYKIQGRRVLWLSNCGLRSWSGTAKWRSCKLLSRPTETTTNE